MQHLFHSARIMPVSQESYKAKNVFMDVLRLDEIHPVMSGNKWFKLKAYLQDAAAQKKKCILTFGGAYSNHIVATAAACSLQGFSSIGIIRGERPRQLAPTLLEAQQYGMRLFFSSREDYKTRHIPQTIYELFKKSEIYIIDEGGYGEKGTEGSMDILKSFNTKTYTHIVAAVGTGTMLSGVIKAAEPHQHIVGISVLKNNFSIDAAIRNLIHASKNNFQIRHEFHFGGYAKQTPELLRFMNDWYRETGIPTDFVYTAKIFYAVDELVRNGFFKSGSSVLVIHSGGLQGNRSLPANTLLF
jgi:1-aminocyclopropane-1-carboxylate deaminase